MLVLLCCISIDQTCNTTTNTNDNSIKGLQVYTWNLCWLPAHSTFCTYPLQSFHICLSVHYTIFSYCCAPNNQFWNIPFHFVFHSTFWTYPYNPFIYAWVITTQSSVIVVPPTINSGTYHSISYSILLLSTDASPTTENRPKFSPPADNVWMTADIIGGQQGEKRAWRVNSRHACAMVL